MTKFCEAQSYMQIIYSEVRIFKLHLLVSYCYYKACGGEHAACLKEALGLSKSISQANCCHLHPWQQAWMKRIYYLFQKHLKASKERLFFQVLHSWKIYDISWVADVVRIATLASALIWKWGQEWLPLGVPGTLQPCLPSSLCWLSQFLQSELECVLGGGVGYYPRYNIVNLCCILVSVVVSSFMTSGICTSGAGSRQKHWHMNPVTYSRCVKPFPSVQIDSISEMCFLNVLKNYFASPCVCIAFCFNI